MSSTEACPGAPLIRECPASIACRLNQAVKLPFDTLYIGDVVEVHTEERLLTDGKLDIQKINPSHADHAAGQPLLGRWRGGWQRPGRRQEAEGLNRCRTGGQISGDLRALGVAGCAPRTACRGFCLWAVRSVMGLPHFGQVGSAETRCRTDGSSPIR
ncbi:MAG: flavin reductase [Desulfobacterales bacterium]|nr:flavin reductase [Desulfobacterales bacterium]